MSNTRYIGFPISDTMKSKITRFLEAAAAGDKRAGSLYVEVVAELTHLVVDSLLLQTVDIANINSLGQKVIHFCANTSNKVSGMLTSKIYGKAPIAEMQQVAAIWEGFLFNLNDDPHGEWFILTPIEDSFAAQLDAILAERAQQDAFEPANRDVLIQRFDELMEMIIQTFFLKATQVVTIGAVTRKMLNVGVDTVRSAIHAVLYKVVKPLEPVALGRYVDHTAKFYKQL